MATEKETKEKVAESLGLIPEIKTMLAEIKTLFTAEKKTAEPPSPPAPPAKPAAAGEAKVEFNHEEYSQFKTSIEDKITKLGESTAKSINDANAEVVALKAELKTTSETIAKQGELLKQTFALVEKIAEAPVALSAQKKKEGAATKTADELENELKAWRKKYITV